MPWRLPWTRRVFDEDDLRGEIRSHLKMAPHDGVADGADPRGAQLCSLKEFGNHAPTRRAAEMVTGNYFQVLGVRAQRGRTLLPSDEIATGRHPVVVISDSLWRRDFEADPAIVGKMIEINSYPMTVVGITDPAFHGTTVVND